MWRFEGVYGRGGGGAASGVYHCGAMYVFFVTYPVVYACIIIQHVYNRWQIRGPGWLAHVNRGPREVWWLLCGWISFGVIHVLALPLDFLVFSSLCRVSRCFLA